MLPQPLGAATHVGVVEVGQTVGFAPSFAVGTLSGPLACGARRTHKNEHTFDGVGIAQGDAFGAAQLTRLGGDAQSRAVETSARAAHGSGTRFQDSWPCWIGQTSVGEERAAPCGLDLRDFAVDDIAWKTKHHVLGVTAVQAGLQHERRTAFGTRIT